MRKEETERGRPETDRRRPRTLARIFMFLVLLGAGSYSYWIQSPTFAVLELEKSIKEKDLATFYSRLDLNRIYDSSIDAIAVHERPSDSPWDTVQTNIGAGVTKILKSQVMNSVKHDIELQFRRDPDAASEIKAENASAPSTLREFLEDVHSLVFGKLVRSGEIALVNVDLGLKKMGKAYPLTLKLEKSGDWKVTGFEGLASSLSLFEKDKSIRVRDHNLNVQRELAALLPFFGQIRQENAMLGLGQQIHLEFLFQNKGTSKLMQLEGLLTVFDIKGETVLKELFARSDLNLAVQEKKVFLLTKDIGIFGSKTPSTEGLTLHFDFDRALFDDGKTLHTVKSYSEL